MRETVMGAIEIALISFIGANLLLAGSVIVDLAMRSLSRRG